MGSTVSSSLEPQPRLARRRSITPFILAALAFLSCLFWLSEVAPVRAQQSPQGETSQAAKPPDKLVIDADQLIYDKDKNTVSAVGSVQLFYQGRILQADRVVYNRATKRVYAEGHAKMTDEHGDVVYGSRFELSDNFREGFIDSVQVLTSDKTRFTSPRVERSNGDVTVLQKGAYTACEPCKDHPDWPPFWQVRAARIIENQETHTVYYEDAQMLVWGVPVFYMPYFSSPDSTVNKQTGVLAPQFVSGSNLGYGISIPYFINLAPSYDLTLIPSYLSKQGLLGEVDWRQRLTNGQSTASSAIGIDEQQPNLFPSYPYGAGDQRLRGSIETKGNFFLNQDWQFGWNATWLSDKFFANDYKLQGIDFSNYYFQDVVSSVYLRGQADHSFFDLSAYHFEGTTRRMTRTARCRSLRRSSTTTASSTFRPTAPTGSAGRRRSTSMSPTSIAPTRPSSRPVSRPSTTPITCTTCAKPLSAENTSTPTIRAPACCAASPATTRARPGSCRGSAAISIRSARCGSRSRSPVSTAKSTELNETGSITYASSIGSSTVAELEPGGLLLRLRPGIVRPRHGGRRPRIPLSVHLMSSSWGTQTITPIGQFIVRPSEVIPSIQPNEDAQSLVFDETNLFAWNKFSGYDRIEGGARLNYGIQYTANFANGGHADVIGGAVDPGRRPKLLHALRRRRHRPRLRASTGHSPTFVAGETLQPTSAPISLISKQQFDSTTFQLDRFDAIAKANVAGVSASLDYALYAAQPSLGWEYPREGLTGSASYTFLDRWSVNGSLVLDMSRHYYDTAGQETPIFYPVGYSFGLGYKDDCTTFSLRYSSNLSAPAAYPIYAGGPVIYNPAVRNQTLMFQLVLRTIGDIKGNVGL